MQTPHNSPVRDRLHHAVEYEEVRYWKDQVAWMGLLLWNMRHRNPPAASTTDEPPPTPHPTPPATTNPPYPVSSPPTPIVGSLPGYVPYTTSQSSPPFLQQRTVRYAYPERQYVN